MQGCECVSIELHRNFLGYQQSLVTENSDCTELLINFIIFNYYVLIVEQ